MLKDPDKRNIRKGALQNALSLRASVTTLAWQSVFLNGKMRIPTPVTSVTGSE